MPISDVRSKWSQTCPRAGSWALPTIKRQTTASLNSSISSERSALSRDDGRLRGSFGREVAFAGSNLIARIECLKIDGPEGAILLEVCRAIDEGVLAAKLFLDVMEACGYVFDLDGKEGHSASGFRDDTKDLVSLVFAGRDVGADSVDDGLGAL